jgi:hypothetical protein
MLGLGLGLRTGAKRGFFAPSVNKYAKNGMRTSENSPSTSFVNNGKKKRKGWSDKPWSGRTLLPNIYRAVIQPLRNSSTITI